MRPVRPIALLVACIAASTLLAPRASVAQPASRPLADLLADASRRNRLPDDLIAYRAGVETEISMILRREEGTEVVGAMEQVASALRWTRAGTYEQHVTGYRSQQLGANFSALTIFRTGWLNPVLYGNRMRIRARAESAGRSRSPSVRSDGADTLPAIHPLAADRDNYYTFSGGDTVVTMQAGDRTIPIVHVRVQPKTGITVPVVLFDGELQLDASRGTLVRLRGHFLRASGPRRGVGASIADAVAFVEYENGERQGQYWLPARQRIELQAMLPFLGDGRAVIRVVSRVTEMQVNDTTLDAATLAAADSLRARSRRRLTYAPTDSLSQFDAWRNSMGVLSEGMHSDDFLDIAPDRWRPTGPPRFDVAATRASDVFHFNRVEGAYTGLGVKWTLRDLAPGVVVRANAGYAWSEQTMRGRLAVERTRGPWTLEARGGRSLDNTNDFRVPMDSGNTFGALLGSIDPYDYVSRSSATLALVRRVQGRRALVRAEVGVASDRYRPATYTRSPFGGASYRPNRGVDEGDYVRSALLIEWHPDMSAEFAKPGASARLSYERGDGVAGLGTPLGWQRVEARVSGRRTIGPFVALARADAGVVTGASIPPQQLFELGKYQGLPGYDDKAFAGSRAASVRGSLQYTTPWLKNPVRLNERFWLPAIAPGVSVGVQAGFADLPTDAARASIDRLAVIDPNLLASWAPVAQPTDRVRASVTAGLRFFGSALFVGATRTMDNTTPWKALVGFGQSW